MQSKIALYSQLLRELEAETGTNDMALLVFQSLIVAINAFKAETAKDFCSQFEELVNIVANTEPKFGILNYHFAKLVKAFKARIFNEKYAEKKWKMIAASEVNKIIEKEKEHKRAIIKNAEKIDVEGKTILIHDHSHTVQDVLAHFKYLKCKFRVVIAEQDYDKTHTNIERMHGSQINFEVVPSYMISHIHDRIDMAFFGAVTLKDTQHFVMDPGTFGVISELHVDGIPCYMFIDTNKFSLWKSKERLGVFIHRQKRKHVHKPIEYERIKYSHDRVPSKLFHEIVTNKGIFTPDELKTFYFKRFEEAKKE